MTQEADKLSQERRGLGLYSLALRAAAESDDLAGEEAVRLAALRNVDTAKLLVLEGLQVLQVAERTMDFQLYVSGARKIITGGAAAKLAADELIRLYGPEAETL